MLSVNHQRLYLGIALVSFVQFNACSKETESKNQGVKEEAATPTEVVSDKPAVALTSGIPVFCSLLEKNNLTCVRCIPRLIAVLKCADKKVDLVPADNCTYDSESLTCNESEAQFEMKLEYLKPSSKEKYYENLEQVVSGIKFVVGATLKDEGENDRVLLFSILDIVVENKKSLFTGIETDKVVDKLMVVFLHKDKDLPEERQGRIRNNIKKALEMMSGDFDESVKGSTGIINFLTSMLEAIKVGNEDTTIANVKMEKLLESLNSEKYKGMIEELLNGFVSP